MQKTIADVIEKHLFETPDQFKLNVAKEWGCNPKDINIEYCTQLDPETNSNVTYANISVSDKVIPIKSVGVA